MNTHTTFFDDLKRRILNLGGFFNAHLHLDRAGTLNESQKRLQQAQTNSISHISLSQKHALIPSIHASSCYDPAELTARTEAYLEMLEGVGTYRADSVVDVTLDRVQLTALECFLSLKAKRKGTLDLRVGAYNPLGFRDDEPKRWDLLVEGAKRADFIGSLPERDEQGSYPAHIGFKEHLRRVLLLSGELNKPVHIHVDQQNHPQERASECVIEMMKEVQLKVPRSKEPQVWLVHVISPSTYPEDQFKKMLEDFVEWNVGVICCPSAAISMRQIRPQLTPTFNSIARVLDFLAAGIPMRVGSDNICDITSPAGTPDLMNELFVLSNAVRFYDLDVLAKLGAGKDLTSDEKERVQHHLVEDTKEVQRILNLYSQSSGLA